jgi:hypothetical protein
MYILTIPAASYLLMLITAGLLVTLGVDKNSLDTVGIFMLYVQGTTILMTLRWLKRKVTK